jgi:hypothetical protein
VISPFDSRAAGRLIEKGQLVPGDTAGVKASREASQTHQTVNRGGSDYDQREEGGGTRADDTGFPSPSSLH